MSKKNKLLWIVVLFCLAFTLISADTLQIDTTNEIPFLESGKFTFDDLDWKSSLLEGPYAEVNYSFNLPGHLKFTDNLIIHLDTGLILQEDANSLGFLNILVNDIFVDVVLITDETKGDIVITIPLAILKRGENNLLQEITIAYENDDCNRDTASALHIKTSSYLEMVFAETAIVPNITNFPYPLYLEQSLPSPVKTYLVVPDNASENTLLAAMNTAAALGSLSQGEMGFEAHSWNDVTDVEKIQNHFVFVGFKENLPENIAETDYFLNISPFEDDGMLYLTNSPWNEARAVFIVTAKTDAGLLKAGKTLVFDETVIPIGNLQVAYINNLNIPNSLSYNPENQEITIKEFGYDNKTVSQMGINWMYYSFNLPKGYQTTNQSHFILHYDFSGLLNKNSSGVTIKINGNVIDGIPFWDKEDEMVYERKIPIPTSYLFEGENVLQLIVNLVPLHLCLNERNLKPVWFTVYNDSLLALELKPKTIKDIQLPILNLEAYPELISTNNSVNPTLFVVPEENAIAKQSAVAISYDIGTKFSHFASYVDVTYGSPATEDVSKQVIAIGLPNELPIFSDYEESLALEFNDVNQVVVNKSTVSFGSPVGVDIGYVMVPMRNTVTEMTPIFIVGETLDGLKNAGEAMAMQSKQLNGNVVIVIEDEIYSYRVSGQKEIFADSDLYIYADDTVSNDTTTNDSINITNDQTAILDGSSAPIVRTDTKTVQQILARGQEKMEFDFENQILQVALGAFGISLLILLVSIVRRKKK